MGQAKHIMTERLRENFVEVEIPAGAITWYVSGMNLLSRKCA